MVKNPKCAFCNKKTSIVDSLSSTCKCRNVYWWIIKNKES